MPRFVRGLIAGLGVAAWALALAPSAAAGTLDTVKQRGALACGVNQGLAGFAELDANGHWSGFDVDFCRAVATAIFGDPDKVVFTPLSASDRFDALKAGKIDLLVRNSTWTFDREASLGILFAAVTYYDGEGFMVARKPEITSALELVKASVCVQTDTTTVLNLADFFRANSMTYSEHAFATADAAFKAFEAGECDVLTTDQSALYAQRLGLAKPSTVEILPDVVSKEPLGPAVRADDVAWFNIVKWVAFALIDAEELGVSSTNVKQALASTKPDVRRLTGAEGGFGAKLGLDDAWAIHAVAAVGNYSEIFERNLGSHSKLGIPRSLNLLWNAGGILYAPPLR